METPLKYRTDVLIIQETSLWVAYPGKRKYCGSRTLMIDLKSLYRPPKYLHIWMGEYRT